MKKITLLFAIIVACVTTSNAQFTLTGTSYNQNFDAIGSGLPSGWQLYTSATATSLGTADITYGTGSPTFGAYWDTTNCAPDVFGTGFKNSASADNGPSMSTATCDTQKIKTNRALAVRQSSSLVGFDPGASFAFEVTNTAMDSAFTLSFELQTLDSMAPRVTTWTVDYGIGATPTAFTPVTTSPATLHTGGNTFGAQTVNVTMPAAINKQSQPVWFRVSTLSATTGSWIRTTSALDNFNLTWYTAHVSGGSTAVANVSAQPVISLTTIGQATSDKITLSYSVETDGAYALDIYDLSGRILHTETVNAQAGTQSISINSLHLMQGMYIAKMHNSIVSSVARIAVQ
jgi:hypothetical protein